MQTGDDDDDDFETLLKECESSKDSTELEDEDYNSLLKMCDSLVSPSIAMTHPVQTGYGQHRFKIITEKEQTIKRFKIVGRQILIKMIDPPAGMNPKTWFKDSMSSVVDYIIHAIPADDFVGMALNTPRLTNGPAWISFRRADQFHADVVWDMINNILQSNAEIFSDGALEINVSRVSMPVGRGNKRIGHGMKYAEICRQKYGIVEINNNDYLCLARALVVVHAWVNKDPCFKAIVADRNNIQLIKSRELLINAQVNIPLDGASIAELTEFQRYYTDYNIVVYEFNGQGSVLFEGRRE